MSAAAVRSVVTSATSGGLRASGAGFIGVPPAGSAPTSVAPSAASPPRSRPQQILPGTAAGALIANAQQRINAVSVPMDQGGPSVGANGLANGTTYPSGTPLGAAGPGLVPVGPLSLWQYNNQGLDTVARLGLPAGAFFLWRSGHVAPAIGLVAGAAVLWANRLTGLNL